MTSPTERALALADDVEAWGTANASEHTYAGVRAKTEDLRSAIRDIGASEPRGSETAPKDCKVSLLLQMPGSVPWWQDCYWWRGAHAEGWTTFGDGWVRAGIKVLAWHPADSTELPANFGEKP